MRVDIPAFAFAFAMVACAAPPPLPPAPDLAAEEQAIRAADSAWLAAVAARDVASESAMLADDGVAFRNEADPFAGPAGYQAYLTKYYADNPKAVNTWTTRSIQVAPSGDFAVQTGTYTETSAGPKGDTQNRGNFITVWKKVGGQWKVSADIGQPIPPAKP
jgi:ketosteroid isomerase-like protein